MDDGPMDRLWDVILDRPFGRWSNGPRNFGPFKSTVVEHNFGPSKIPVVEYNFGQSKITVVERACGPSKVTTVDRNFGPSIIMIVDRYFEPSKIIVVNPNFGPFLKNIYIFFSLSKWTTCICKFGTASNWAVQNYCCWL